MTKNNLTKEKKQKGKSFFNLNFLNFLKKSNKSKAPTQTYKSKPVLKSGETKQSILYLILISLVVITCVISVIAIIWVFARKTNTSKKVLGNPADLVNVKTITFQNGATISSDNGLEINIEKLKDNNMKLIGNNASANFQLNNTGDSGNIVEFENLDSSGGNKGDLWYFNNKNESGISKPEPEPDA